MSHPNFDLIDKFFDAYGQHDMTAVVAGEALLKDEGGKPWAWVVATDGIM